MEINQQVQLFEKQAKKYAKRRKKNSMDQTMRKKLLQSVTGNILELSVGAGANFAYYPKTSKITAVDFSPSMIEKAKEVASEEHLDVDFMISNVEELQLPLKSYDTVVSTLSLCSYPHPEKVLDLMASWCKDDGQILLLEHGISSNAAVSWLQNKADAFLEKKIGCHQNRDILKMVEEAPLKVNRIESSMLNSVHLIWASPMRE